MKKIQTLSKILIVFLIAMMCICCVSTTVRATDSTNVLEGIEANTSNADNAAKTLKPYVNRFLGLMQILSAFAAVVVIVWCGFSYILGTPEGKAEIKKNMIPLVVGIVVVFAAASIARLIFGLMG